MYQLIYPACVVRLIPIYFYYVPDKMLIPYRFAINSEISKTTFTTEEAIEIAKQLNIDFSKFDIEQFRMGLDVELEHGKKDAATNVTNDDPIITGKIALAHLNEFPDYYTRLAKLEVEAEKYWSRYR
ncbi:hypothetical protein CPJCM30710_27050 [Clostridium polyendosporum]|uniref:Uncharacterized protein n=2 Tax=Clostridium polyendosporum TaxID=69208 RepID=A0A919S1B4_9CLOT|nr:hypothetical protein CPJCM30710_27050 [Clostridium polyendosporum]